MSLQMSNFHGECRHKTVKSGFLLYVIEHICPTLGRYHTAPMKIKNITRYTYENTDFQGWCVSIQRCGRIITRYFSDLQYGSEEASYRQALDYRDAVFRAMDAHRDDLPEYMDTELRHVQQILLEKGHPDTQMAPSRGEMAPSRGHRE